MWITYGVCDVCARCAHSWCFVCAVVFLLSFLIVLFYQSRAHTVNYDYFLIKIKFYVRTHLN